MKIHSQKISDWRGKVLSKLSTFSLFPPKQAICCTSIFSNWYGIAAANTWPVGNLVAYVNDAIAKVNPSKVIHTFCIGQSLGSHVCGFFGKMQTHLRPKTKIHKIIALDPAGPIYEYKDHSDNLRLNKNDAAIVEVFHTNTLAMGYSDPIGDVDFYINGGRFQPGCNKASCKPWKFWNCPLYWACCHAFSQNMYIYLNNKDGNCYANWKCRITKGYQLGDIEDEVVSKLKSDGCTLKENERIELGILNLSASDKIGTYWVDADNKSKTCKILPQ